VYEEGDVEECNMSVILFNSDFGRHVDFSVVQSIQLAQLNAEVGARCEIKTINWPLIPIQV